MNSLFFPLEKKVIPPLNNFLFNALFALGIFILANLGKLLGITTMLLPISLVWPAAGLSLAAILLFGYRMWPGILFGNFAYNFFQLSLSSEIYSSSIVALIIALGSLTEVLLGAYIIKRFSSPDFFDTVEDIFIFLVPASLIVCMIGSTVGILTLYFYGILPSNEIHYTWLTFWVGDSMGIYILTPFIFTWTARKIERIKDYDLEAALMCLAFLFVSFLTFVANLPVMHLCIPLSLWITYRFGLHGATLFIVLFSFIGIASTAFGYGSLITYLKADQLFILISFLGIMIATCLIFAAVINERTSAWKILQEHNLNLKETVETHSQELKEMHQEIFIKEKLASLGQVTLGISNRIEKPLNAIGDYVKDSLQRLNQFKKNVEPDSLGVLETDLEKIKKNLEAIISEENYMDNILRVSKEHSERSDPGKIKCEYINLHTLINMVIEKVIEEVKQKNPDFTYNLNKQFDTTIKSILALPDDLNFALKQFLNHAFESMNAKKKLIGSDYIPMLSLQTFNHKNKVELVIRDNGLGIPKSKLDHFFISYLKPNGNERLSGFSLGLAHDIIVHVHRGEIVLHSQEGEFFEIRFTIPKK